MPDRQGRERLQEPACQVLDRQEPEQPVADQPEPGMLALPGPGTPELPGQPGPSLRKEPDCSRAAA